MGCLPQKLAAVKNVSHDLDSFGCISSYNAAAMIFNEGLLRICTGLRSAMKDASIVYVDVFAIKFDMIANSTKYGKTIELCSSFTKISFWGCPSDMHLLVNKFDADIASVCPIGN